MENKKYRWKYETEQLKSKTRFIEFYKVSCPDCNTIVTYDSIDRRVKWDYCPYCGSKISYEEQEKENK